MVKGEGRHHDKRAESDDNDARVRELSSGHRDPTRKSQDIAEKGVPAMPERQTGQKGSVQRLSEDSEAKIQHLEEQHRS